MKLFGSLRWDRGTGFFYRFKGGFEKHCTRASLHSDTVEDLIINVEGPSLEDFDARESVASWCSRGQRSRRTNYKSWPSEGNVTAMKDSTRDAPVDRPKIGTGRFLLIMRDRQPAGFCLFSADFSESANM